MRREDERGCYRLDRKECTLVYGVAKTADTGKRFPGEMAAPMYKAEIQNSKSKVVKTHQIGRHLRADAFLRTI